MPVVEFVMGADDIAYSTKTYKPLSKKPTKAQIEAGLYVRKSIVPLTVDAIKARAKEIAAGKAAANKAFTEQARATYIGEDYAARLVPTKKGDARRVGTAKDSYLAALNASYALVNGIPLNRANRTALNRIYTQEIAAAVQAAGPLLSAEDALGPPRKHWAAPYSPDLQADDPMRGLKAASARRSAAAFEERQTRFRNILPVPGTRNPFAVQV